MDRQKLAEDGIIIISMQLGKAQTKLLQNLKIQILGLIGNKEENAFNNELSDAINLYIGTLKQEMLKNLESNLKNQIRRMAFKRFKRYPTIIINIFYVN